MPRHRKRATSQRMLPRDDRHLPRQRSAQLTQSVPLVVLWRKTSGGTQTEHGERFVERILSIRETCRLQDLRPHPYLIDVHTARLTGQPIPTPLAA
jgi:hypothetical protein